MLQSADLNTLYAPKGPAMAPAALLYPVAYALMTRHTTDAHEAVLRCVARHVDGMQDPAWLMADFEPALRGAFRRVWPGVHVSGCWFHFGQAVLDRAVDFCHMKPLLQENAEAGRAQKMLMTLPLLPMALIVAGLDYIEGHVARHELTAHFAPILQYMRTYWINEVGVAILAVGDLYHRTNNGVESFHKILNTSVGVHPSFWRFFDALRRVDAARAVRGIKGRAPRAPRPARGELLPRGPRPELPHPPPRAQDEDDGDDTSDDDFQPPRPLRNAGRQEGARRNPPRQGRNEEDVPLAVLQRQHRANEELQQEEEDLPLAVLQERQREEEEGQPEQVEEEDQPEHVQEEDQPEQVEEGDQPEQVDEEEQQDQEEQEQPAEQEEPAQDQHLMDEFRAQLVRDLPGEPEGGILVAFQFPGRRERQRFGADCDVRNLHNFALTVALEISKVSNSFRLVSPPAQVIPEREKRMDEVSGGSAQVLLHVQPSRGECSVCIDAIQEQFKGRLEPCGHSFCMVCATRLNETRRKECALCRAKITSVKRWPN
ncbi:uncharacterized protein LOC113209200 [Frankliniella occidentalis]|uniref:Uncharacterized protein LOC113209200 n=1 Tax=Frankliniella occidentalis TaxID=133901 RepID=A0A9C6XR80_FRAOC|nr:uncharacterized protein LOC113209200 [Frankliniella occidentalis]